ncbi:MAG TPA: DNA-directed DNA polymerase II small subunit [Nitrososphaeraceae archaeon]|nr:DNA-directed DNA polymerase II small subunit [Nitrososphaeraceae archaeon]
MDSISIALIYAINKGYQVHPDAFAFLKSLDCDVEKIIKTIVEAKNKFKKKSPILIDDIKNVISSDVNGQIDEPVISNSNTDSNDENYKIIFDPTYKINSENDKDFYKLFDSRYRKTLKILSIRSESRQIRKVKHIKDLRNKSRFSSLDNENERAKFIDSAFVAGLIMSKRNRKNDVELVIDDTTGSISVVCKTQDLINEASSLVLDQMLMLEISLSKRNSNDFVIKDIIFPDIPEHVAAKSRTESYVALISDLHVGSKYFMENEFNDFISWLSSNDEIASKIKFVCIAGDIVDGIGIYPNQDKELIDININKQMSYAAALLQKIPKRMHVFLIPGNHDPGRRALPQTALTDLRDFQPLENFSIIGNPSIVELNKVKLLMFHGQSLDDVIATVPGLSYSKPVEAMKILLKSRHLSPIYGNRTPIAPESEDMLVIEDVPDIFHAGHVHITEVGRYKGTLIVNSGAWQKQTKFQQTMGINPTPGICILVNLGSLQSFKKDFNY